MDFYLSIIVIIFSSSRVLGDSPPSINSLTDEKTKSVGSTVEFVCKVSDANDYPVRWAKLDSKNDSESHPLNGLADSRIHIEQSDDDSSTTTLKIENIEPSDAGWYRCEILSPAKKVTSVTRLTVQRPPSILENSTRSIVVMDREGAQLECYADGIPTPTVTWRRENNAILPGGHSIYKGNILQITRAHKEDRGLYFCVAENCVGKSVRRKVSVNVKFAPEIHVEHVGYGQVQGKNVDMSCIVTGYPEPSVYWLKDSKPVSTGSNSRISNFQTDKEEGDIATVLTIDVLAKSDYGEYTCKAENTLGSDKINIKLYDTTALGGAHFRSRNAANWCSSSSTALLASLVLLSVRQIRLLTSA